MTSQTFIEDYFVPGKGSKHIILRIADDLFMLFDESVSFCWISLGSC